MHHLAICCRDMDRQLGFYRDLMGFEVLWDMPGRGGETLDKVLGLVGAKARMVMLTGHGSKIELFQYESPEATDRGEICQCDYGYTHFALSVKGLHDIYDKLHGAGVRFNCPPQDIRAGVVATYMRDPEGNTIELIQYDSPDAEAGKA